MVQLINFHPHEMEQSSITNCDLNAKSMHGPADNNRLLNYSTFWIFSTKMLFTALHPLFVFMQIFVCCVGSLGLKKTAYFANLPV